MRIVRFLPLTFLLGMEGFVLFLPYLLLCVSILFITRYWLQAH